jgi:hypothetical protein
MFYSSSQFNYYGFDKEIIYLILVVKFFSLLLELAHSIFQLLINFNFDYVLYT